jgi:hypothetical protein
MPTYNYGTDIDLTPIWAIVNSGKNYMLTIKDDTGFIRKIRMFRGSDDDPGTMRLYNNVQSSNVQVASASVEWVQVPDIPTDVWIEGDIDTGMMKFREHLEPEPVL